MCIPEGEDGGAPTRSPLNQVERFGDQNKSPIPSILQLPLSPTRASLCFLWVVTSRACLRIGQQPRVLLASPDIDDCGYHWPSRTRWRILFYGDLVDDVDTNMGAGHHGFGQDEGGPVPTPRSWDLRISNEAT